jgi:membrane protease YdiL (CAAX protease family)
LLLVTALAAGLIGGLIEETLFRGAMLTAIQQRGSTSLAVISTSFIYALVHFLQPETYPDPNTLNWLSGFAVLKNAFSSLLQPVQIVDSFIALFLAGTLLAIIKIRTDSLAMCIGMHAGWVFIIKIFRRVTNSNENSDYAFLTGSYDQVIGYLAAVCVTLAIIIYIGMKNRSQAN